MTGNLILYLFIVSKFIYLYSIHLVFNIYNLLTDTCIIDKWTVYNDTDERSPDDIKIEQ